MALNFSVKIQSEIDESKNFRVEQAEIKYISAEDGLMLKSVYDTDENGIYEYVIECEFYYERND